MGAMINEDRFGIVSIALSPVSVAANTTAEQSFTIPGVKLNDYIDLIKPTAQAGLAIGTARVSAANTVGVTFINNTGSPIVPTAAETYLFYVFRAEKLMLGSFNP